MTGFRKRPTVLHGIPQSGPSTSRPKNAGHGATYLDDDLGRLLYYDGRAGAWFDAAGPALWSTSSPRYVADHFNAGTIDSRWSLNRGSDTGDAAVAAIGSGNPGYATMTTGNAGSGTAADAVAIAGPLAFEAEEGAIHFATRVKFDAVADLAFYVGFHDVLPASTLEMPFTLSGTSYTSTATDGCGFLYDTAATTDTIRAVSVANDTDGTHVDTEVVPVLATWIEFGLVINTVGTVSYYINGTHYTTMSTAIRPGIDLCPIVAAVTRTTTVRNCDIDYIAAI